MGPLKRDSEKPTLVAEGTVSLVGWFLALFTIFGVASNVLLWIYISLPYVALYRIGQPEGRISITFPGHFFGVGDLVFFLSFLSVLFLIAASRIWKNWPSLRGRLITMALFFVGLLASTFLYLWQAHSAGQTEVEAIRKAQASGAFGIAWILLLGLSLHAYRDWKGMQEP
jgi:hypothetical protein